MPRSILFLVVLGLLLPVQVIAQQKSVDQQVAEATQAAPADMRDGATVLGYRGSKTLQVIRPGTGELVCHADDSDQEGIIVACYHKSLEPFMAWGRDLRVRGVMGRQRQQQRIQDARDGKFKVPDQAAVLYVLNASEGSWDASAGSFEGARVRMVLYVPGATQETLGISEQPSRGWAWLMMPGTAATHIMLPSLP